MTDKKQPERSMMDLWAKLDAIEGIKIAKARHRRGIDTKDSDLLGRAFATDVTVDVRGVITDPTSGQNVAPATDEVLEGADKAIAAAMATLEGVIPVQHVTS